MSTYVARFCVLFAAVACLSGCRKTESNRVADLSPETTVSLKDFSQADNTYLLSTVHVYWTGTDQDGFVAGYQINVNDAGWSPTMQRTDSTFLFTFASATLTQNVNFKVRAVDNLGVADPTPAEIVLPIRNTPPVAKFVKSQIPVADTVLGALSLGIGVTDFDGDSTLEGIYFQINDGGYTMLPLRTTVITLVPTTPTLPGVQAANIYINTDGAAQTYTLPGLVVDGTNTFRLYGKDKAGAISPIALVAKSSDTTQPRNIFFRRKTSDLLVIDANIANSNNPDLIYPGVLALAYPQGYDYLDIVGKGGRNLQAGTFSISFPRLLAQYSKIFWYEDDQRSTNLIDNTLMLLETAAPTLSQYISQGGKLLLTAKFPDGSSATAGRLPRNSPVFGLLPADSISWKSGQARLYATDTIFSRQPAYPNLLRSRDGLYDGVDIFYKSVEADTAYDAHLQNITVGTPLNWRDYTTTVAASRKGGNGKPNLVFFSVELHRFNGNPVALQSLFSQILTQDFN